MVKYIFIFLTLSLGFIFQNCDNDPLSEESLAAAKAEAAANGTGGGGTGYNPGHMNIVCSGKGNKPADKVQCLAVGSAVSPHYYGDAELLGTWKNSSFDVVMTLKSDGSGTWTVTPTIGSPSTHNTRWGVLLNKDGSKPGSPSYWYVTICEDDYGDLIDGQAGAATYSPGSKIWSTGWTR